MQIIKSEKVVCFDVDDTLVIWGPLPEALENTVDVTDPYTGVVERLLKHLPHIKLLKNHKVRGSTIIVWSAGGYRWAEAVIKALGLEEFVDFIASKPLSYVDDSEVKNWMPDRIYLAPDHPWGVGANTFEKENKGKRK